MKERMKSAGSTEADINTRIDAMRISLAFGGSPARSTAGTGGGFGGGGFGGGGFGGGAAPAAARTRVSTSGQIWVKEGDKLKVVRVRSTLKDGTYASVESPELKDSMLVVVGAVYDKNLDKAATSQSTNPLMPQARRGGLR